MHPADGPADRTWQHIYQRDMLGSIHDDDADFRGFQPGEAGSSDHDRVASGQNGFPTSA
jgi:hypothetical protein